MTVKDYIDQLPLPIRERWLRNLLSRGEVVYLRILQDESNGLAPAMSRGFLFFASPEGESFWKFARDSIGNNDKVERPQQWLKEIREKFDII